MCISILDVLFGWYSHEFGFLFDQNRDVMRVKWSINLVEMSDVLTDLIGFDLISYSNITLSIHFLNEEAFSLFKKNIGAKIL